MSKSGNPPISIIVSTKNEERNLPRLLSSIKQQNDPSYELIIVDNCSSDQTVKIAAQFTSKVYNHGPERSSQRNYGAKQARGEFLLFLDADMELEPNSLTNYLQDCQQQNCAALCIPETNPDPNFWSRCRNLEKDLAHQQAELQGARFIRKKTFHKVGGYDQNLIAAEDYDLDDRLRERGVKIGNSNTHLRHYENTSLIKIAQKKYYYGKMLGRYLKKSPRQAVKRFNPLRDVYLRKWKQLVRNSRLTLGLLLLKIVDYTAGGLGLISCLNSRKSRNEHVGNPST